MEESNIQDVKTEVAPATVIESKVEESAPVAETKPELILGKFKSSDDLQKAYLELEKKLSGKPKEEKKEEVEEKVEEKKEEEKKEEKITVRDVVKEFELPADAKPAVDFFTEKYGSELSGVIADVIKNDGKLSEKGLSELKAIGMPVKVAEAIIASEQRILEEKAASQKMASIAIEKEIHEAIEMIGGDSARQEMAKWARSNLNKTTLDRLERMSQGSPEEAISMLFELESRYTKANGRKPRAIISGKALTSSSDRFTSIEQLAEAMSDPRYKKDEAFRASVHARAPRK